MDAKQLNAKLADLKKELFNLRFQLAINQLDNPHKIADVLWKLAVQMSVSWKDISEIDQIFLDLLGFYPNRQSFPLCLTWGLVFQKLKEYDLIRDTDLN